MKNPTTDELRILTTFFRTVASHYGLYDKKEQRLSDSIMESQVFIKNLEILRNIKKSDREFIESACRVGLKNKKKLNWISELPLKSQEQGDQLKQNLVDPERPGVHRLLKKVTMPAVRLSFGARSTDESEEAPEITYVETFTLSDLLDYFSSLFMIQKTKDRERAWAGAFDYLLKCYSLDTILFAMDFSKDADDRIIGPLDISKERLFDAEDYVTMLSGRKELVS